MDSISSALLAATTTSVKTLQGMKTEQDNLIKVVNDIAIELKSQGNVLNDINNKPEPEILSDIKSIVTDLSTAFSTIDLDGLERSINDSTREVVENSELSMISRMVQNKDAITDHFDSNKQDIIDTISKSNNTLLDSVGTLSDSVKNAHDNEMTELADIKHSGQIETLRKLITGLKAQRNNLDKLANYIEILSNNVHKNRKDVSASVNALVDTVQDSNARTKSIDLRLSSLTNDETYTDGGLEQSLELLNSINSASNKQSKRNLPNSHSDELEELNSIIQTFKEG